VRRNNLIYRGIDCLTIGDIYFLKENFSSIIFADNVTVAVVVFFDDLDVIDDDTDKNEERRRFL